jgi:hypothetical protein
VKRWKKTNGKREYKFGTCCGMRMWWLRSKGGRRSYMK